MKKNVIEIKKDCSGKTYEYNIFDENGNNILSGDGYNTPEEIKEDLTSLAKAILNSTFSS